jgi:hypothetical protein
MHICPVCGYNGLIDPPANFTICPSCGTEFEYDDAFSTHAELRASWLRGGAKWWSPVDPEPPDWDPYLQVSSLIDASRLEPPFVTSSSTGMADSNT